MQSRGEHKVKVQGGSDLISWHKQLLHGVLLETKLTFAAVHGTLEKAMSHGP